MSVLGFLICAVIASLPFALGLCIILFLRGQARILTASIVLALLAAGIVFVLSPLPVSFGLSRDPGYDSDSWVPLLLVGCEIAALLVVAGMVVAVLGRYIASRGK